MEEVWKDIVGFEGFYQVSNLGRVKSLQRVVVRKNGNWNINERILKQKNKSNLYLNSALNKNGKTYNIPTHQLVAIAFLNHTPCGFKLVINHKNLNKHDNKISNLEIVTTRENTWNKKIKTTSKYPGVCWNKFRNKWQAQIKINGVSKNLGCFLNELDAKKAYKDAFENL